jgi:hypothetical protein
MLPDGAPDALKDRQQPWGQAEAMERRRDAQVAREINLTLPRELDASRRKELLLKFVQEAFVDRGMAADVAIPEPVPGKNASTDNHHARIMLAMRRVTRTALHRVKTREWNATELVEQWRELWASHQNRALELAGKSECVDHRTLVAQRNEALARGDRAAAFVLNRKPEVHVGPEATRTAEKLIFISRALVVGPPRRVAREKLSVRRVVDYRRIDKGLVRFRCDLCRRSGQSRQSVRVPSRAALC